jgi:VWFA-related protein
VLLWTVLLVVAAMGAQQAAAVPDPRPQAPQTTFKTGIDVVQLDVSVLDKVHRPVAGLTAADFTVLENGKPQPIVAVVPVDIPEPVEPPAPWMRDVAPDVLSNERDVRRLVVIVLDDANTGFDRGEAVSARKIAHGIVDNLGPADLAAVTFTFLGRLQTLTSDRAALGAAIESFNPKNSESAHQPLGCGFKRGGCVVDTLAHVAGALRAAPQGRKMVMFISSTGALKVRTDPFAQMTPVLEMFQALQRANVAVYTFDPSGVRVGLAPDSREDLDDLQSISDGTGGRSVFNTNTPEASVPEIFRENRSYYLVGFRSTDQTTAGRFRRLQVRVSRPDATVRTRSGYFAPKVEKPSRRPGVSPRDSTLRGGLTVPDLPLRASLAAFATPGSRQTTLTIVTGVRTPADPPGTRRVELVAAAFDTGWHERGVHRQTIEVTARSEPSSPSETITRLTLKPGRYEIRLAAESEGRTGGVVTNVDIPDFSKDVVMLSGILIERQPSGGVGNRELLRDLVPVIPTTVRSFRQADRVTAFVRVYQGGRRPVSSVPVLSRIVNEQNETVFEESQTLGAETFAGNRAGDYRLQLPLARLARGSYLLRVEASLGTTRASQDVGFVVE